MRDCLATCQDGVAALLRKRPADHGPQPLGGLWARWREAARRMWGVIVLCGLAAAGASPAAAMSFEQVASDLFATGPITAADVQALRARLETGKPQRLVLVNSAGGELRAGLQMARLVQAAGVETLVSGHCHSACSLIFLAGRERAFATGHHPRATVVGIHGPSRRETRELSPLAVPQMLEFYRQRMGSKFAPEVIEPALTLMEDHTGMLRIREPGRNRPAERVPMFCPSSQTPAEKCVRHDAHDAVSLGVVTRQDTVVITLPQSMQLRPSWFGVELEDDAVDEPGRVVELMPEPCRALERCRQGFEAAAARWLQGEFHRAVAVPADGKGYTFNLGAPTARQAAQAALYSCNHPKARTRLCRLLLVDDRRVPQELDPVRGQLGLPATRDWPVPGEATLELERSSPVSEPRESMRTDAVRLPTPAQAIGAQRLDTREMVLLLQQETPPLVFDVAGEGTRMLPGALHLINGGRALSDLTAERAFDDRFKAVLRAAGAASHTPLVFYGEGPNSWWAFNAARRAVLAGFRQVMWYRGGLEAWQRAGLPTQQKTAVAVLL